MKDKREICELLNIDFEGYKRDLNRYLDKLTVTNDEAMIERLLRFYIPNTVELCINKAKEYHRVFEEYKKELEQG